MDPIELLRNTWIPCAERMTYRPFWECNLPRGHTGDHVSLHANPWQQRPKP